MSIINGTRNLLQRLARQHFKTNTATSFFHGASSWSGGGGPSDPRLARVSVHDKKNLVAATAETLA
jgi:hypothetical protein